MKMKSIRSSSQWAIDLLERASKNLAKMKEKADHCQAIKLRVIQTQVDTALLIARETITYYTNRKVEEKRK
jgi:hypothetical protein